MKTYLYLYLRYYLCISSHH